MAADIWLFSYGTLRLPQVQHSLFGREVDSVEDVLTGYELDIIVIADPAVIVTSGSDRHPILRPSEGGTGVPGAALLLTNADLAAADRYETEDYARIAVVLASGREAFVYVERAPNQ